ncbi:LysR family transcriptional regulator [Mesobacterium pallidum]|uniref:LysR family transcriptional regulator n=1 Tax=Mesobacterium pallidum TaxID=2872037 RepID=UPI001EE1DD2F|nr:LysR family transcriptional regulator [Mesobacterium pallidum]
MLKSKLMTYIDAVSRHGSIRKASEALNIAPSAVNRQILECERTLGMPLFDRLPRGMKLTSAGEVVVSHIRRMDGELALMDARLRDLRGLQAGTVRLVAASGLMSSFVARIVSQFCDAHPLLDLKIDTQPSEEIVRMVGQGDADLGLSFDLPRDPDLITLASMHQPLGVVVAPGHPMATRPALRLSDCVGERMVLPPRGSGIRVLLDVAFAETRIDPQIVVESNSVELRKALVRAGAGITILAAVDLIGDVADGTLAHVPLADPHVPGQTLKLVSRAKGTLEPLQAKLAEAFRRAFAELGAEV